MSAAVSPIPRQRDVYLVFSSAALERGRCADLTPPETVPNGFVRAGNGLKAISPLGEGVEAIGTRLRSLRHELSFTLDDIARSVGVTRACVCQWESGKTYPRHKYLRLIAEVLNTSVGYLLNEEELRGGEWRKATNQIRPSRAAVILRARLEIAAAMDLDISSVRIEVDGLAGSPVGLSDPTGRARWGRT